MSDKIDKIPPLHCFLQKFLEIFQDENAAARDLENILGHDEALSSKIMRIANSAYYGFRGNVSCLSRAILTIGFREVKSVCLSSLLLDQFPASGPVARAERKKLWKHALATANHASEIARIRPWIKRDQAYLLGLLHDLGWLAMLTNCEEGYQAIAQMAYETNISLWEAEAGYQIKHTQIGKWIATKWGLPERYKLVMMFHHDPGKGPCFDPAVGILFLANVLAHSNGSAEPVGFDAVYSCCRQLRIPEIEWQGHLRRVPEVGRDVERLWQLMS